MFLDTEKAPEKTWHAGLVYKLPNRPKCSLGPEDGSLCFRFLVGYSVYSSTLEMEAVRSSETSVNFYQTTRRQIPENSTHQSEVF
jgi:hypothetical protein